MNNCEITFAKGPKDNNQATFSERVLIVLRVDLQQASCLRLTTNLQRSYRLFATVSAALGLSILRCSPLGVVSQDRARG
jgi:hypothetical protein